jgi:hypothetical protein
MDERRNWWKSVVNVYVEGGGESNASLKKACRGGFRVFLRDSGLKGRMPKIIACGKRSEAYKRFCKAVEAGQTAFLLVDSEKFVPDGASPWKFLHDSKIDQWSRPLAATDEHCHLMVQCMENWFLADQEALEGFFRNGFQPNRLPRAPNIESISEAEKYLKNATEKSQKGTYSKAKHAFSLLGCINPQKVMAVSPWARRFIETLKNRPTMTRVQ